MISERSFEGGKLLTQHSGRSDFVAFQVSGFKFSPRFLRHYSTRADVLVAVKFYAARVSIAARNDEWQVLVCITFQLEHEAEIWR